MLNYWQSHQEYLRSLHEAKISFDSSQRLRLQTELAQAREKLRLLNLDSVMIYLEPFYAFDCLTCKISITSSAVRNPFFNSDIPFTSFRIIFEEKPLYLSKFSRHLIQPRSQIFFNLTLFS